MTIENENPVTLAAPTDKLAKKPKKQSRADRWNEAIGKARAAHDKCLDKAKELEDELSTLADAMGNLRSVQEEFEEWQGNLPDNVQSGPMVEKLEAVTSLDIDSHTDLDLSNAGDLDDIGNVLDECEGADLPLGFGRD